MAVETPLDPDQVSGLGDMEVAAFRAAAHDVVDRIADYLATIEDRAVFPDVEPGTIAPMFPAAPPEAPELLAVILDDVDRLILPNLTNWQHPGFFAFFATSASGPGMLGEFLTAALGQNPMLWRTSPVGTELEGVVVGWLRQALGLPATFDGLLTDTASTSSMIALAAAREAAGLDAAAEGLTGRDLPQARVYASAEAHSSIDKACMTLGLGRAALVKIPTDAAYGMDPAALGRAITADRAAGRTPVAIVGTIGTTSSTAIDPIADLAEIAATERLWLHVDSAYAGPVALLEDRRAPFIGWDRADSIVVNPHKWLFLPLDASLLLTRRMGSLHTAFSLRPDYLALLDLTSPARDYTEFTPQLGRRFRALKLWIHLRWFGIDGIRRRIARHLEMAEQVAGWIDADPAWERLAPVPFSTVCLRHRPAGMPEPDLDAHNEALIAAVNRTGEVFLSSTRLSGRFTIRLALGNLRTEPRHVERAWALLQREAARLQP